jgi:hypothetical protein
LSSFAFELSAGIYEVFGLDAKPLRNGDEVRLVRFQEAQHSSEQPRLVRPSPQLVGPDSGQVDEPLCPAVVTKRCRQRGEGHSYRIIVVCGRHSLRYR